MHTLFIADLLPKYFLCLSLLILNIFLYRIIASLNKTSVFKIHKCFIKPTTWPIHLLPGDQAYDPVMSSVLGLYNLRLILKITDPMDETGLDVQTEYSIFYS
jgi:hypothetical protein